MSGLHWAIKRVTIVILSDLQSPLLKKVESAQAIYGITRF